MALTMSVILNDIINSEFSELNTIIACFMDSKLNEFKTIMKENVETIVGDKNGIPQIIPSNELRLIPLHIIIDHIYEKIIEKATNCEFYYDFNIDKLIKHYEINTKIATPANKIYIINEIKRLFPGIKINEINEINKSYLSACWEEDLDDSDCANEVITDENNLETYDDIILKQSIQESLKEVKKLETTTCNSIMGKRWKKE